MTALRKTAALVFFCAAATARAASPESDAVAVNALRNPVDKPYRKMVAGLERFEKRRHLAPEAALRFKLLPRNRDTRMENLELEIASKSFATPVAVASDHTFTLVRDPRALKENASVTPNRKAGTLTWRAEIRTPGLPPGTRRLGDLRLECEVGMEAGLISNYRPVLFGLLVRCRTRCCAKAPNTAIAPRRATSSSPTVPYGASPWFQANDGEVVSVDRLYGGASRDPDWKEDLPYCDCEVLMDRAYFLPLGDRSWPDDTRVEFEFMDGAS